MKKTARLGGLLCLVFVMLCLMKPCSVRAEYVTVISGIPKVSANTTSTPKYSSYWQYWSQGASGYKDMRSVGCRVVAYSKLLAEAGMSPGNPDEFYRYMSNNGYINSSMQETGSASVLGRSIPAYASSVGGTITCVGRPTISGSNASNAGTVMDYINQGYYVVLMSGPHTVYVGRQASLNKGKPVILDSWSSWSSTPYLPQTMSDYNRATFTRILVFSVGNKPNPPEPSDPWSYEFTPYSGTDAKLKATYQSGGKGSYTGAGIRIWRQWNNAYVAAYDETCSHNMANPSVWYEVNKELKVSLQPGVTYLVQFYVTFNGSTIWSAKKTYTSSGSCSHSWIYQSSSRSATVLQEGSDSYRCEHCGAYIDVSVPKLTPTITLDRTSVLLKNNESVKITVSGLAAGDSVASWRSADTAVATVSDGLIRAGNRSGSTAVTVTLASGKTAAVSVKTELIHTHRWNAGVVTKAPTCTQEGIRTYTCLEDSAHTRTESIPKTAHTPGTAVKENQKAASCTANGSYDEVVYCSVCRAQISRRTVTVPMTGHTWMYGKVTKAPTAAATGVKTYTCKACKAIRTEAIPKLQSDDVPVPVEQAPSVKTAEKKILNLKGDEAPGNARFNLLQLRTGVLTGNSVQLKWKKVKGASGYIIYGARCGQRNKRLKILNSGSRTTWTQKNLKAGRYYKYFILATAKKGSERRVIATSTMVHAITNGGTTCNYKAVKLTAYRNKVVTLKKNQLIHLKAKGVPASSKRKVKSHRALRFESTNKSVAVVGAKTGRLRAKKQGRCYVYIYAQNGQFQRIRVIVK